MFACQRKLSVNHERKIATIIQETSPLPVPTMMQAALQIVSAMCWVVVAYVVDASQVVQKLNAVHLLTSNRSKQSRRTTVIIRKCKNFNELHEWLGSNKKELSHIFQRDLINSFQYQNIKRTTREQFQSPNYGRYATCTWSKIWYLLWTMTKQCLAAPLCSSRNR